MCHRFPSLYGVKLGCPEDKFGWDEKQQHFCAPKFGVGPGTVAVSTHHSPAISTSLGVAIRSETWPAPTRSFPSTSMKCRLVCVVPQVGIIGKVERSVVCYH